MRSEEKLRGVAALFGNGSVKPWQAAVFLHSGLRWVDLAGFSLMLYGFADLHWVWRLREAVLSQEGVPLLPTTTFDECPLHLDVLFVPSGVGVVRELDCLLLRQPYPAGETRCSPRFDAAGTFPLI